MPLSKRLFDLFFAFALSLIFVPILLGLLVWLSFAQGRPFFFVSERMKTPDQSFGLIKLRTMEHTDTPGGISGGHKTNRITPAGRFLRKTRFDELPQLWNVVRGDVSFVGPRPPLREVVERFPDVYAQVLKSRPGITGLASLVYHSHEERLLANCHDQEEATRLYERICIPRKAKLDLIYQRNAGFCFDFLLFLKTLGVFTRRD